MVAPGAQDVASSQSSQRRRKGTIASRYLEAIGIQCGAITDANTSKNSFRSSPISKGDNGHDFNKQYYSFNDNIKSRKRAPWSESVYDKISSTTKAADCSKSIITASTAVMLDHSDSISTTPTSPGGSGYGKSPHRRPRRRGRSPTVGRIGTNSYSKSSSRSASEESKTMNGGGNHSTRTKHNDNSNLEYINLPGTRSTAPLSDGVASAPSTPSRLNQRRKEQFEGQRSRARSWHDRTSNAFSCNIGESKSPMTPLTTKSIMGGLSSSNSDSDSNGENSTGQQSPNTNYATALDDAPSPLYDAASPVSSQSGYSRGRDFFPKTSPRRPSDSPGPQPRSPPHYAYSKQEEQTYSRSLFSESPKAVNSTQLDYERGGDISYRSRSNAHPLDVKGSFEASPSSHSQSEPTDSEAGAPTEITKNHRILRRPYHLRRPSSGDGGNQLLLKDHRSDSSKGILSRVRNRFHSQNQGQKLQNDPQNDAAKASMRSLLDVQSSSVSSALPMYAAQADGAPASILSPSPASGPPSRLSRHVENARKQSIWSPSASECTPSTLDNETYETNGSTSLTTNIGLPQDHRLGAKPFSSLQSAKPPEVEEKDDTTAPKVGGLRRPPVGARVAALEARYRKGKFTVRGARSQKQDEAKEEQQIGQAAEPSEDEDFPDPILSVSHTMDENENEHENNDDEAHAHSDEEEENDDDEWNESDEDSGKNSHDSPDYDAYEDEDDESTLPEYSRNQNEDGDFIAYNDRQTPNTDGVFQLKPKDNGKLSKSKGKKTSARSKIRRSKDPNRVGKSPIQPLFSSERLDENNKSSIQESSVRSRSLGRTKTSNQFMKIAARRSKSLSERSDRKHHLSNPSPISMELSEAMRIVAKNRKTRNQSKSKQGAPHNPVPGNIVVKNEKAKTEDGAEASRSGSSLTRSSTQSTPSQPARRRSANKYLSSETEEFHVKSHPSTSIKDKIRAFNLKKSPGTSNSNRIMSPKNISIDPKHSGSVQDLNSRVGENSRGRTNLSKRAEEEKKEDWNGAESSKDHNEAASFKTKRNNLERKSLWARYFAENANKHDNDESASSTNDDYSVQSLREQFEQKNDVAGEEDDDDRSVKSLREMFEEKKQTGQAISHLKARFEPKPKAPRLSMTKQNRLPRKESSGKTLRRESTQEPDAMEHKGKREATNAAEENNDSFEWWKLDVKDSQEDDGGNNAQTTPMFRGANRRNSSEFNKKNWGTSPRDVKTQLENTVKSKGNRLEEQQIFGSVETRQAPLKDNNRKNPGYHWKMQGSTSDGEHQIQKKRTKESLSDSEYSEAVTLDPSFAEVSNLSNPSALQSPDTDRQSDASSSVLFENLQKNQYSSEPDRIPRVTSSELALPELKESRREAKNAQTVPGNSNATYRNSNFQNVRQNSSESGNTYRTEDPPRIVTPDNGRASGTRGHFFNRVDHVDTGYGASVSRNDVRSESQSAVSTMNRAMYQPDRDVSNRGSGHQNGSSGKMPSSHRITESPNRSSRTNDISYHSSDASTRSMRNSYRGADSSDRSSRSSATPPSNRSSRSSATPQHGFEPSYRSTSSERFSEPTDSAQHAHWSSQSLNDRHFDSDSSNRPSRSPESSFRSARSMSTPHREVESSSRSTRSSDTPKSGFSNFHDNYSSHRQNPNTIVTQTDYGSSQDGSRDQNTIRRHNLLVGSPQTSSKPPTVPAMPSPFDEDYAAIMESRHKMLMVRQRALLNRRANREKSQTSQQGFFGRTNPVKTDAHRPQANRTYRDSRSSTEDREYLVAKDTTTMKSVSELDSLGTNTRNPTRKSVRELDSLGTNTRGPSRANKTYEAGSPKSPIVHMLSMIRPSLSVRAYRDNETSQKQAVIDRISAVRAARLRRNMAYGKVRSSNNYEAASHQVPTRRLETIDDSMPGPAPGYHDSVSGPLPGYRYYPHYGLDEPGSRDDDTSLSTRESNPQEWAAQLSVD